MLCRTWNLVFICSIVLPLSCFRSYEVSHVADVDGGGPSLGEGGDPAVAGGDPSAGSADPSVGGGDPSAGSGDPPVDGGPFVDDDNPFVNDDTTSVVTEIEGPSLLGRWEGSVRLYSWSGDLVVSERATLEFTDTEIVLIYGAIEVRAGYSTGSDDLFRQLDIEPYIPVADVALVIPGIYQIENNALTLAFGNLSTRPQSFIPSEGAPLTLYELTRVSRATFY